MYFFTIIILWVLALSIYSKPTQVLDDYDKEAKEDSYGDNYKPDSDDYLHNDQKPLLKQDDSDAAGEEKEFLENIKNDQAHNGLLLTNSDVKRTADYKKSHMLFKNPEKPRVVHYDKYNGNEMEDSSNIYVRKPNTVHNTVRNADIILGVKDFESKTANCVDRERRQVRQLNESVGEIEIPTQKYELNTNDGEETAIRRHIKKLSKEELDELLHSLSDDKRILLQNIIDNYQIENETLNKREITKKAGANEVNSFVGNEQSDTSKVRGGSDIKAESSFPNTEKQENMKKPEGETICSESTEIVNTSEKSTDKVNILDNAQDIKLESDSKNNIDSSLTQAIIQTGTNTEQESSKIENKREINVKFMSPETKPEILKADNLNTEDYYCSDNDDLSRLWNEESKLYDNYINKRDTSYNKKSLEESFPNSEDATNLKSETNMLPLIRVKRKNFDKILEKRDVNELSNLKVPFHSNAADDIVEESEGDNEGSELEDNGFFDRRTNFAAVGELKTQDSYDSINSKEDSIKSWSSTQQLDKNNNNLESDIVGLGSDSDAVLSGIEGVDDNIMYSSVSRNKRTSDDLNNEENFDNVKQKNIPKLVSSNEDNDISEENNNALHYKENDSFGSLPRNYEEELGRFKRIRRLKPMPNQDNN